jgi:hypothetical protein
VGSTVFRPQLILNPQLRKIYDYGHQNSNFFEKEVVKAKNLFLDSNAREMAGE